LKYEWIDDIQLGLYKQIFILFLEPFSIKIYKTTKF